MHALMDHIIKFYHTYSLVMFVITVFALTINLLIYVQFVDNVWESGEIFRRGMRFIAKTAIMLFRTRYRRFLQGILRTSDRTCIGQLQWRSPGSGVESCLGRAIYQFSSLAAEILFTVRLVPMDVLS